VILLIGAWKSKVSKRTFRAILGFGTLGVSGLVSMYFLAPAAINKIFSSIGIHTRVGSGASSLSHERLEMWRIAWGAIKESFWLGHGQGSWTREFGKAAEAAGRPDLIFDTAHNFFVQSVFELGILHSLLIVSLFAFVLINIGKKIFRTQGTAKKSWFVATCAAYAIILAVQEVDFVRSSFYQHAVFWGFVIGDVGTTSSENIQQTQSAKSIALKAKLMLMRNITLLGVLAFSMILAFISLFGFSLAGSQYEANAKNGFNPKVRWLGSFGTLNYILPRADQRHPVARFKVLKTHATEYSVLTKQGWSKVQIANPELGSAYIDIPASTSFQLPLVVKFNDSRNDFGRNISTLVEWPPQIIEGQER
jgi:hypothetical protein